MTGRLEQRGWPVLAGALVLSAAVHLGLGLPLRGWINAYLSGEGAKPRPQAPVSYVQLSRSQWEENRRIAGAALPAPKTPTAPKLAEPKKPPAQKVKLSGQIVEVAPSADQRPNPNAKLLASRNSHADKESVARYDQRDKKRRRVTAKLQQKERASSKQQAAQQGPEGVELRGDGKAPGPKGEGEGKKSGGGAVFEIPDIQRTEPLKLQPSELPGLQASTLRSRRGSQAARGNSSRVNVQLGGGPGAPAKGGGGGGVPNLGSLAPTIGTAARISGSPSSDYVEGVAEGEGTYLNTKEFKYATFFYRVRDSVGAVWEGMVRGELSRRDPSRQIYGGEDRFTTLSIQLDAQGRLTSARVARKSGLRFLDRVAVRAFRRASPFPRPPPAMADEDGSIRFNFQFALLSPRGMGLFR